MGDRDFDWYGDDSIVFPSTQAVAVYRNQEDMIVIRQEANAAQNEDPYIIISKSRVPDLIRALQAACDQEEHQPA